MDECTLRMNPETEPGVLATAKPMQHPRPMKPLEAYSALEPHFDGPRRSAQLPINGNPCAEISLNPPFKRDVWTDYAGAIQVDGYTLRLTSSHRYFYDSDTGDLTIQQRNSSLRGFEVNFGPLCTTLGDLFNSGFYFDVVFSSGDRHGQTTRRTAKVRLTDGETHRYLLYRTSWHDFRTNADFGDMAYGLRAGINLVDRQSVHTVCVEVESDRDPFEVIAERYPTKKRKVHVMIGNRTLKEYVEDKLS